MKLLLILLAVAGAFAAAAFLLMLVFFFVVFHVPKKRPESKEEYPIPKGKIYEPFREQFIGWMKEVRALPCETVSIRSFDGLNLYGKYYEYAPGATIEIMFHGYRGSAERDLCGGVQRCFALGHSALIVDQRTSGRSEGTVITFGVLEYRDCLDWLDFVNTQFRPGHKIILTGISMGASTVLNAAGTALPPNVIGVLADCGYDSPRHIMKKVMRENLHLPADLLYPLVRLSAKLFGHFDPDAVSPVESLRNCKVPVFFLHGEADDFVPCEMSRINYNVCPTRKRIITVPGAGHGLGYPIAPERYLSELKAFFHKEN